MPLNAYCRSSCTHTQWAKNHSLNPYEFSSSTLLLPPASVTLQVIHLPHNFSKLGQIIPFCPYTQDENRALTIGHLVFQALVGALGLPSAQHHTEHLTRRAALHHTETLTKESQKDSRLISHRATMGKMQGQRRTARKGKGRTDPPCFCSR